VSWIANNYNPAIALPNTWDCMQPIPKFPYQITINENDDDYQHFLCHAIRYVRKEYGGYGQFFNNENKGPNPRPSTVTLEDLIDLYWANSGSYCR
jgi:hypothetical protein